MKRLSIIFFALPGIALTLLVAVNLNAGPRYSFQQGLMGNAYQTLSSVEDETSYTSMRGSFVDGQAWFSMNDVDLAAQWPLTTDYESGGTYADIIGGNDGTGTNVTAGATYAEFNGTTSKIDLGGNVVDDGDITWSVWIYEQGAGDSPGEVIYDNSKFVVYWYDVDDRIDVTRDGSTWINSGSSSVLVNTWYHVLITSTLSGVTNIYLNGVLSGTANQDAGTPATGTTNDLIGDRNAEDRPFDGYLYDKRIYNSILSTTEITAIYGRGREDLGGLANYAGTGNLLIADDGDGDKAYGYIGAVGGGEVATALTNDVTGITSADPGVVSSVAHGLAEGDLVFFDSLTEMTELNDGYRTVTAVGSADLFSIDDTSGYAAETTGGACGHEVTEPNANAVKIFKEYSLTNEGWNTIDSGIDYNAGTSWDFDVYAR